MSNFKILLTAFSLLTIVACKKEEEGIDAPPCKDGIQNYGEFGVDCGGNSCSSCEENSTLFTGTATTFNQDTVFITPDSFILPIVEEKITSRSAVSSLGYNPNFIAFEPTEVFTLTSNGTIQTKRSAIDRVSNTELYTDSLFLINGQDSESYNLVINFPKNSSSSYNISGEDLSSQGNLTLNTIEGTKIYKLVSAKVQTSFMGELAPYTVFEGGLNGKKYVLKNLEPLAFDEIALEELQVEEDYTVERIRRVGANGEVLEEDVRVPGDLAKKVFNDCMSNITGSITNASFVNISDPTDIISNISLSFTGYFPKYASTVDGDEIKCEICDSYLQTLRSFEAYSDYTFGCD